MAATVNQSHILTKIQKLLALSNGKGTTEAEASLAAEHVQRLLQDHELTLAQVEAAGGGSDESARREKKDFSDLRAMYTYQRTLMGALANNNFCLHVMNKMFTPSSWGAKLQLVNGKVVSGHMQNRHVLVGRELNVAVTVQTYVYLIEALERACPYDRRTADGKRFLEGGASRVAERLTEKRRQQEEESARTSANATTHAGNGTHTELVLSDVYGTEADLNNDTLNGFPAGTTASRRRTSEAKSLAQTVEHDRLVAEGVDTTVAWYRAYGYSDERAVEAAKSFARSSRRGGGRGRTRNWTRGDDAHYAKINSASYKAGRVAGANIGLDDQVSSTKRKQIGEG